MENFCAEFEDAVLRGLRDCGVDLGGSVSLGAAVSGGADSVALLVALSEILKCFPNAALSAVTVDHAIRPREESAGDADFVESLCKDLGVPCVRMNVPEGHIKRLSRERGTGVEEAARAVRYERFESFVREKGVDFLCLAHHADDQCETVLMRFLQGSADLSGIPRARSCFIRPMLGIKRSSVERYLEERKITYRTDSTNRSLSMLRNRIRNCVMPVLDEAVPGWRKSVLSLSVKAGEDSLFIRQAADSAWKSFFKEEASDGGVAFWIEAADFIMLSAALRWRLIMRAADGVHAHEENDRSDGGPRERVPWSFCSSVSEKAAVSLSGAGNAGPWSETCGMVCVRFDGKRISVQRKAPVATESGFFVIVERGGLYVAGPWSFSVSDGGTVSGLSFEGGDFAPCAREGDLLTVRFPFVFRSLMPGDRVRDSGGRMRGVSGILDGWKCGDLKFLVPVVQNLSGQEKSIAAVLGAACGFKDWIVRNEDLV